MSFPPLSPTTRLDTIKSYLYEEYFNDDDLQSFVTACNEEQQQIIDAFNALNLPIYTGLSGALLDWVGTNLYGISRPSLSLSQITEYGTIDSFVVNDLDFNDLHIDYGDGEKPVTDDIYKRTLTWHYWRGDGFHITTFWLKRRVIRFLYGIDGGDPYQQAIDNLTAFNDDFYDGSGNVASGVFGSNPFNDDMSDFSYDENLISVKYGVDGDISITFVVGKANFLLGDINNDLAVNEFSFDEYVADYVMGKTFPELAYLFKYAVESGVLETPFQQNVYVNIGSI